MNIPDNLKYTHDHEWVSIDGDIATVGVTEFAQAELGDVVFIDVDTLGETLDKEEVFGTIEAVKTVSDILLPLSGEIIKFNEMLEDTPEIINKDPYGDGWIIKVKCTNLDELGDLLDASAYKEMVSS